MDREKIFKMIKGQFHLSFLRPKYLIRAFIRTLTSKYRREIIVNHLNLRDVNTFIKLINNPPDLF